VIGISAVAQICSRSEAKFTDGFYGSLLPTRSYDYCPGAISLVARNEIRIAGIVLATWDLLGRERPTRCFALLV
jgi:hypothetical protein